MHACQTVCDRFLLGYIDILKLFSIYNKRYPCRMPHGTADRGFYFDTVLSIHRGIRSCQSDSGITDLFNTDFKLEPERRRLVEESCWMDLFFQPSTVIIMCYD